jgi:hypothetical protein
MVSLSRGPVVRKESSRAVFPPTGHAPWHFLSVQKSSVGRAGNASCPKPYPASGKLDGELCPAAEKSWSRVPSYPDASSGQACLVPTLNLSTKGG